MSDEKIILKPCPFCGKEPRTGPSPRHGDWAIYCPNVVCGAMIDRRKSYVAAASAWNQRTGR